MRILDKNIVSQERGLFRKSEGGNEWQFIPPSKGSQQKLSDQEILELSKLILKIEKHYGFPCDIEWARENGKFYIVQSRPITTLSHLENSASNSDLFSNAIKKKVWLKNWSGNWGLPFTSLYGRLYTQELTRFTGRGFEHNIVLFEDGVSSNFIPSDELGVLCNHYAEMIVENSSLAEKWCDEVFTRTDSLTAILATLDAKEQYTIEDYHMIESALYEHVPPNFAIKKVIDYLPPDIIEKYLEMFSRMRVYTEHVYSEADRVLHKIARSIFPELSDAQVAVLTAEDMEQYSTTRVLPKTEELNRRIHGVGILFDADGKGTFIYDSDLARLLSAITQSQDTNELKGLSAFKGLAQGRVRIVFDPNEATDFAEGDILVTGMTRPEFLPLMQKSAAFVTDAGGLLSHAAIMARELKKPCVVGTNIATKVLKDGDLVEVDANEGVVRILSAKK